MSKLDGLKDGQRNKRYATFVLVNKWKMSIISSFNIMYKMIKEKSFFNTNKPAYDNFANESDDTKFHILVTFEPGLFAIFLVRIRMTN